MTYELMNDDLKPIPPATSIEIYRTEARRLHSFYLCDFTVVDSGLTKNSWSSLESLECIYFTAKDLPSYTQPPASRRAPSPARSKY